MNEVAAQELVGEIVGKDSFARVEQLVSIILTENTRQNLIASSTVAVIWQRHVLDSVQLLCFAPDRWSTWIDIGTGGGFPGLAIACALPKRKVILVEPRKLRTEFLRQATAALNLSNVEVLQAKAQSLDVRADVISARAVAAPSILLSQARGAASASTRWLLPVGCLANADLNQLAQQHRGMTFHVEQSLSNAGSSIMVGTGKPS